MTTSGKGLRNESVTSTVVWTISLAMFAAAAVMILFVWLRASPT